MRQFKQYLLMGALLLLGNSVFAESKVTIDFTTKGYENTQLVETIEQDGITLTFDMGTNKNAPKYYNTGTAVRCYGGNVISISATKNISRIDFVFSSGEGGNNIIPSEGRLDSTVWVGSSQYFTLTIDGTTGHRRFHKMEFTLEDAVVESRTATTIQFTEGYQTQIARGPDGMFPEIGSSVALPTAIVKADSASIPNADVEWSLEVKSWKSKGEGELPVLENGRISFEGYGVIEVKASFAGNDDYLASSKSYTLTVYNSYGKLSEMVKDIVDINGDKDDEDDKDGSPVFYFFRNIDAEGFPALTSTVTYVNGKYIYLTDGEGYSLLFYGTNTQNLKQGDKISGNVGEANLGGFWGNLKRYKKLPEFVFTDMNVKVESEGNAVEPTTIAADKLVEYINAYVKIENAQLVSVDNKNLVFKVGETDLAVYNQFSVDLKALELGATYTLTGMGSIYNTTKQLNLIEFAKTADAPAGVNTISTAKKNGAIYNLAGQRVQTMSRGLYIKDGKKFIVK